MYKLTDGYGGVNTVVSVTSADSLSFEISREFKCKQKYPRIKVGRELRYQYDIYTNKSFNNFELSKVLVGLPKKVNILEL